MRRSADVMGSVVALSGFFVLGMAAPRAQAQQSALPEQRLSEVVVSATLRDTALEDLPQSATVLRADALQQAGVQHFGDVLGLVPDLTAAAGSSRPRYFLMRGIGEVEQYQGAPNPSIGFLIDDIDFSGVGMPATLFDLAQVEVLRGPQGTVYGANALGGLISVRTQEPTPGFGVRAEATAGDYRTRAAGLALNAGAADGDLGARIVAQDYRSDGYRHDAFLGRSDTNGYDEGTLRARLFWQIGSALRADVSLMRVTLNNGYDAWSIDNSFTTQSNQPGRDAQFSDGGSLRLAWLDAPFGEIRSVTSAARSNIVFSFDADWGNDPMWAACCGYSPYDYFEQDQRTRRTLAEDLRILGDARHRLFGRVDWLAGLYVQRLTEADALFDAWNDQYAGAGSSLLQSRYGAYDMALYGSLEADLGARSRLSLGLRAERRRADYRDSAQTAEPFAEARDTMWGGNLSWIRTLDATNHAYVTLARGFKGGGFNIGTAIEPDQRRFAPEYLWSLETGLKHASTDGSLQAQADLFYMRRYAMQVYTSQQLDPSNPATFVFFTRNAAHGENYGLETQAQWAPAARWRVEGSAALLRTRYLGYDAAALGLTVGSDVPPLDGRAQSFAPGYQLSAAVTYTLPSGWFVRADAWATDGFYFAASHDQTQAAYQLLNLRCGYARPDWSASLWVRNLADRRYATQGFYFGDVPPDFSPQRYIQNGDPRTFGLTLRYDFK